MLTRTIIKRYGLFAPDGTGVSYASLCVSGTDTPDAHEAGLVSIGGVPQVLVPLDDQPTHWARLYAEHEHAQGLAGNPARARHSGGKPHPKHPHIQIGGTISWTEAPHDAVRATMTELLALSEHDLHIHLTGQAPYEPPPPLS